MIMTDAGYGLLLLLLLYLFRARFKGSALGRRMFRMSVWLMISTRPLAWQRVATSVSRLPKARFSRA